MKGHCRASERGSTGPLGNGSSIDSGGIVWDVRHVAFRCRRGGRVDANGMEQTGKDPERLIEFGMQHWPGVGKGGFEWVWLGWSFIKLMPSNQANVLFQGSVLGDWEMEYMVGHSHRHLSFFFI